jgi:UDP-N-acetylglucosamine--dolichyl-phosphate N-acetylglucosaminephosphotransferase
MIFLIFLVSFAVSFVGFPIIIPRLKRAGITGKNMNSEKQEEIPEMGGLVIAAGFGAGIIFAIGLRTFDPNSGCLINCIDRGDNRSF